MWRKIMAGCGMLAVAANFGAGQEPKEKSGSSAEQYERLVKAHEDGAEPRALAARFIELAEQHPRDKAAIDALVWVLTKLRNRPEATRALELLEANHLQSEGLTRACRAIERTFSTRAEKLLQAAVEQSPHKNVRAQACWHWALLLEQQATVVEELKKQPELAERMLQYYGQEYGKHLTSLEREKLAAKRESVYERLLKSFAEVPVADSTMGAQAEKRLFQIRHLSVGRVAPEIQGEDIFGSSFKLSDYRGKIVVLSFWGHW